MRPFGALIFGRVGDLVGRKYTFLVTIVFMGIATVLVGFLPTYATLGFAAPLILVALRLVQGLALGGEYGGAATYVAEHAPDGQRGYATAWIQTTATVGMLMALIVIGVCRYVMDAPAFANMVIYVTMVYGPIAAFLVELFPTRIRYTSMSLPYDIGNGWFGGMLPLLATAMVATAGNIYFGLWYPIVVAIMTVIIGGLFVHETKDHKIHIEE